MIGRRVERPPGLAGNLGDDLRIALLPGQFLDTLSRLPGVVVTELHQVDPVVGRPVLDHCPAEMGDMIVHCCLLSRRSVFSGAR